jgi:DNA-directed RNA polymerase subunit K/omega
MAFENKPIIITEETSFEAVVDTAFERVNEKHIQYSMRRIREMNEVLAGIEKELNDFLSEAQ